MNKKSTAKKAAEFLLKKGLIFRIQNSTRIIFWKG